MFEITGITETDLRITKGDSATLEVELYDEQGAYKLKTGDSLVLNAKKSLSDSKYAISLKANSNAVFAFKPSTTANLTPGVYLYDIQLTLANGNIYTVIPLSHIVITNEVTRS